MALIHDIARLASEGHPRADIAADLDLDPQVLNWLMDSDSFAVIMEQFLPQEGV